MKYYIVAELNVTDGQWIGDYVQHVTRMVEKCGGRYLARTDQVARLEGDRENPQVFLIIEWPSEEAALRFYGGEEYKPFLKSRLAGSVSEMKLVAGEDINGVANVP